MQLKTSLQSGDIRYASNTQLQMLFGISSKKFGQWTDEDSLPLEVAQKISAFFNLSVIEVLEQWGMRRLDAQIRRQSQNRLNEFIIQERSEYSRRYYQLQIQLESEQ